MKDKRSFWLGLCLINLCIVAFFGFTLRSKILFSLPSIDYRSFLSAHSHFAFAGWVGLSLTTLLIYDLLPAQFREKKIYQWILIGIEVSSLGMAVLFPLVGYTTLTIIFSSLYIIVSFVFASVFIRDITKTAAHKNVKLLSITAILSLLVSSIGPLGLLYIIISKTANSILYRDSIYTFLHFQYNGFFTLAVLALFFNELAKKQSSLPKSADRFSLFICLSIIPALFLSLLWHNNFWFYAFAASGVLCIMLSLYFFLNTWAYYRKVSLFDSFGKTFLVLSAFSFLLKLILQIGPIIPTLGDEVYGDRPVIIGFLHLVFLAFVTFYIFSNLIASGYFTKGQRPVRFPFIVFAAGVILNEFLLMIQGVGILFKTNSQLFQWLLWGASILLFCGSLLIAFTKWKLRNKHDHITVREAIAH